MSVMKCNDLRPARAASLPHSAKCPCTPDPARRAHQSKTPKAAAAKIATRRASTTGAHAAEDSSLAFCTTLSEADAAAARDEAEGEAVKLAVGKVG
jgi:hypothetical protein